MPPRSPPEAFSFQLGCRDQTGDCAAPQAPAPTTDIEPSVNEAIAAGGTSTTLDGEGLSRAAVGGQVTTCEVRLIIRRTERTP